MTGRSRNLHAPSIKLYVAFTPPAENREWMYSYLTGGDDEPLNQGRKGDPAAAALLPARAALVSVLAGGHGRRIIGKATGAPAAVADEAAPGR